jgi:predicted O-methyltransferase YrrM
VSYPGFSTLSGWCPAQKADRLAVLAGQSALCVEIGVFGGQSFFAMAWGNPKARLIAIDPWTAAEAAQECAPGAEEAYYWDGLHAEFIENLHRFTAHGRTTVLRMTSELALNFVQEPIDLLHIDGNHSENKALFDVKNWLPKMRKGGVIVMDDVNWQSVKLAAEWLKEHSESYEDFGTWAEARV